MAKVKRNRQKEFRDFHCKWITYYPHIYPHQTNPESHMDESVTHLFYTLDSVYLQLARKFGTQYVLNLDWHMFLANFDVSWESAVEASQDLAHQEFITKACHLYQTLDYDEFMDFDMEDLEDEFFGPLSEGFYGIELSQEQAEHLIGLIVEGR